jgi:probable poly-beta-1,6-N-acetyl-D-glucosamine export protein
MPGSYSGGKQRTATEEIVYNSSLIRGIAILLVIVTHATSRTVYSDQTSLRFVFITLNVLAHSGVPIFLILSGFFLSLGGNSSRSFRKYGKLTLKRILPSYVIWYLIYYVLFAILKHQPLTPLGFALDFLTLKNMMHLWFILLITQFYLLFPLLHKIYNLFNNKILPVAGALAIQLFHSEFLSHIQMSEPWSTIVSNLFLSSLFYLIFGFWLKDFSDMVMRFAQKNSTIVLSSTLLLILALTCAWQIALRPIDSNFEIESLLLFRLSAPVIAIGAFLLTLAGAVKLSVFKGLGRTFIAECGLYSYGIYLIHLMPLSAAHQVTRALFQTDNDLAILIGLLTSALGSLLLVRWMTKWPFSKYYL